MSDGASGFDIAGIVGGFVTFLGSVGGGVKWLFGRAERREKALDAKEQEYVAKLEARIAALEERDERREAEVTELRTELHDTRAAVFILAQEVAVSNPNSPALVIARRLLNERFPLDLDTPPDMTDTLSKLG